MIDKPSKDDVRRLSQKKVKVVHAHQMVANTALEMANELYEAFMHDNAVYAEWKRQHPGLSDKGLRSTFVKKFWPRCIESARATLAAMLSGPYDDDCKQKIHEGLILDATLKRGRARGMVAAVSSVDPMKLN